MYYIINLEDLPNDLAKEACSQISYMMPRHGRYLHIVKETYEFYGAYGNLAENHEFIDEQELKEIMLIKHLKD